MSSRTKRYRILRASAWLLGGALVAGFGWLVLGFARITAGYASTIAALQVFGAGDTLATVEAERLQLPFGLGRFVELELDVPTRAARATAFGLVTRTARWRDGLGATRGAEASRSSAPVVDPSAAPPADLPWPLGESPALAPLPAAQRAALEAALATAFIDERSGAPLATHAVVVVRGGRLLAERYSAGTDAQKPLLGWSMTKSVMATLLGRMIFLGRAAGVAEPVLAREWSAPDDPRRAITLEHLLRMTSGLEFLADYEVPWSDSLRMLFVAEHAAAYAADKPLVHPPGTRWSYSDGSTNLLARWIQERAGATLAEQLAFARRELFAPLGMSTAVISVDAGGTWVGSSLMQASARDWARLGLLYAQDGRWGEQRLLPDGWVDFVAAPTAGNAARSYGAGVWRYDAELLRDGDGHPVPAELGSTFYFAGHDQQFVWIDRARRIVIVRLGLADERFAPATFAARLVRLLSE